MYDLSLKPKTLVMRFVFSTLGTLTYCSPPETWANSPETWALLFSQFRVRFSLPPCCLSIKTTTSLPMIPTARRGATASRTEALLVKRSSVMRQVWYFFEDSLDGFESSVVFDLHTAVTVALLREMIALIVNSYDSGLLVSNVNGLKSV